MRSIAFLALTLILTPVVAGHTVREVMDAINQVEASGHKSNVPLGDRGRARGPLQIHVEYHSDSRVAGTWAMCEDYEYSVRVATAYMRRYEPAALDAVNARQLAMLHHYGPGWRGKNSDPDGYWAKVKANLD